MKSLPLVILIAILAVSLGCSSNGTTTIQKDAYGNISGQWQMVVDDNGYVSWVWVAFSKPCEIEIEDGRMTFGGSRIGSISPSSAELTLDGGTHDFVVCQIEEDRLLLISGNDNTPNFRLTQVTLRGE